MTSQAPNAASSASNQSNPFLKDDGSVYTSQVPLSSGAGAGGLNDPLIPSSSAATSTSGSATTATGRQDPVESLKNVQTPSGKPIAQVANEVVDTSKQIFAESKSGISTVTADSSVGHAGSLAPSKEVFGEAPEGTEHVNNIITGLLGAVISAPAAALEALSPTAASKTAQGVEVVAAKLPSTQTVVDTTRNAAATAYNAVPEGTGATIQGYTGAAVGKAQEVLPPALGGSATTGNTGEGITAKSPTQIASEYGNAASAAISNAAGSAIASVQQALGLAQQKATEAANVTAQKASETANAASAKASDLTNQASATASNLASSAQQTANDAANKASATASNVSASAQQTASDAANKASATASDVSNRASATANDAANRASNTTSNTLSSASTTGQAGSTVPSHADLAGSHQSYSAQGSATNYPASSAGPTSASSTGVSSDVGGIGGGTGSATQTHTGTTGQYGELYSL